MIRPSQGPDTLCEHKGIYIKGMIKKVLDEYEVPLKNVVKCVTDNARSMVTTVQEPNLDIAKFVENEDDYTDDDGYAHTPQLAVGDGLKHNCIKGIVAKQRNVTKEARTPNKEGGCYKYGD